MATVEKHILFRPMLPDDDPAPDVLFPGTVLSNGRIVELSPEIQHLACFAGGMFALGGRLLGNEDHVETGERLARGCAWAYDAFPTGIMPEKAELIPCVAEEKGKGGEDSLAPCAWNETRWRERARQRHGEQQLPPPGFAALIDPQYQLRPEAIESIFVLYRVTGKPDLLDVAWRMFESITAATRTRAAYSAIEDVRATGQTSKLDSMEVSGLGYYCSDRKPKKKKRIQNTCLVMALLTDIITIYRASGLPRPSNTFTLFSRSQNSSAWTIMSSTRRRIHLSGRNRTRVMSSELVNEQGLSVSILYK